MSLLVHRGGHIVTRDDLALVPVPGSDRQLSAGAARASGGDAVHAIGQGHPQRLHPAQRAVRPGQGWQPAVRGARLQERGHRTGDCPSASGNSYDKSMAIGIAIGAEVFVCDNLALTGDITIMKKHTQNVWQGLEDAAIATLYRSQKNFQKIVADSETLKGRMLDDTEAFKLIGLMFGHGILTPRQLPVVKNEWLHPGHTEFEARNMWSFYNGCTESLKSCPPVMIMEKHIQLHTLLTGN